MPISLAEIKQAIIARHLRRSALFAGYPTLVLDQIAAFSTERVLEKNDYLFHEQAPACAFFILLSGAIKVHRFQSSGREQVIRVFRPYEALAEETLVSDCGYPASACATEASRVLVVQRAGFLALLRQRPELALSILGSLGRQVSLLVGLLEHLTLEDIKTRLARWLLQHCPDPQSPKPHRVEIRHTKRLLASELGVTSETFSRTLAKLRADRLVSVQGNTVTLLSPIRLNRFLHGVPGPVFRPAPARLGTPRKRPDPNIPLRCKAQALIAA